MIPIDPQTLPPLRNPWGLAVTQPVETPHGEILHLTLPPGGAVRPHLSPVDTIFIGLAGVGLFELDGEVVTLAPGLLLNSPAGTAQSFTNRSDEDLRLLIVKIPRPTSPPVFLEAAPAPS